MSEKPYDLMIDILRRLQSDMAEVKEDLRDLKDGQVSSRNQLHALATFRARYREQIV